MSVVCIQIITKFECLNVLVRVDMEQKQEDPVITELVKLVFRNRLLFQVMGVPSIAVLTRSITANIAPCEAE